MIFVKWHKFQCQAEILLGLFASLLSLPLVSSTVEGLTSCWDGFYLEILLQSKFQFKLLVIPPVQFQIPQRFLKSRVDVFFLDLDPEVT